MVAESAAAFLGSRAGCASVVSGSPEVSMMVVHHCAAQTAVLCWWQRHVEPCPFSLKALYAFNGSFARRVLQPGDGSPGRWGISIIGDSWVMGAGGAKKPLQW